MSGGEQPDRREPERDRGQAELPARLRYKPMAAAYQGAVESVFALAIGVVAGWWADRYFGTTPWCLAVGATIGFAAFVLRLTRLGAALDPASSEPADAPERPGPPGDHRQVRQDAPPAERQDERPEEP